MLWLIHLTNFLTRLGVWFVVKFLGLFVYYPISFIALFRHVKRCPPIEDDILLCSVQELIAKIKKKDISCVHVIESYKARCLQVNNVINAIVEDRFSKALQEAAAFDALIANANDLDLLFQEYPLLGVPISIKSSIGVEGCSHAAGRYSHRDVKATSDAEIVRKIKLAGAIPILVSNTPELCYNWETYNRVTGTTKNPYDTRRTVGGSSGGEAALLASAASVIGLGSDVGGSLRIPAAFCGVWGHKPTAGALSYRGHYPSCDKEPVKWTRYFTVGPMARFARDLPVLLKLTAKDEVLKELGLDETVDLRKLKVFYMLNDGGSWCTHRVHNDIKNAIKAVATHFANTYGCSTEKLKVKSFKSSAGISFIPLLSVDGVEDVFDNNPSQSAIFEMFKMAFGCSKNTMGPVGYLLVKRVLDTILSKNHLKSLEDECDDLRDELENLLGDNGVFVYPTYPNVAHFHGQIFATIFDGSYMTIFNALGLPVTNCPVGFNQDGLPIGIQVVAKSNCDRVALAVAQEVERVFGGWRPPTFHKKVDSS